MSGSVSIPANYPPVIDPGLTADPSTQQSNPTNNVVLLPSVNNGQSPYAAPPLDIPLTAADLAAIAEFFNNAVSLLSSSTEVVDSATGAMKKLKSNTDIALWLQQLQSETSEQVYSALAEIYAADKDTAQQLSQQQIDKINECLEDMQASKKSGLFGKIFGWIATSLMIITAIITVQPALIVAAAIMLTMQIDAETGGHMAAVGNGALSWTMTALTIVLSLGACFPAVMARGAATATTAAAEAATAAETAEAAAVAARAAATAARAASVAGTGTQEAAVAAEAAATAAEATAATAADAAIAATAAKTAATSWKTLSGLASKFWMPNTSLMDKIPKVFAMLQVAEGVSMVGNAVVGSIKANLDRAVANDEADKKVLDALLALISATLEADNDLMKSLVDNLNEINSTFANMVASALTDLTQQLQTGV